VVEPFVYAGVAALFYVGIDLATSVYYSSKYDDKDWEKVKVVGIFTRSLKNVMKNNREQFKGKEE
jgi:hypothetical protein